MAKGTIKTIIILVGSLFLNIEAAQAGLIGRFKFYIHHEFSNAQIFYSLVSIGIFCFMAYVIFTPVVIGKQRRAWLSYYSYSPTRHNYQSKRDSIRKIEEILKKQK